MCKGLGRLAMGATVLAAFSFAAADELVYFTNGAEMAVHSHTVEKDKGMVKLDLGGNSFISFPLTMVDKIVDAGRDVFLNPSYHPANQAVEGSARLNPTPVQEPIRNSGGNVGYQQQLGQNGANGSSLGEATIGTDAPHYSKSPAGTVTVPARHSSFLQKAVPPPGMGINPVPQTGQATINNNPSTSAPRAIPFGLRPDALNPAAVAPPNGQPPEGSGQPATPPPPPPPPPPQDDSSGQQP